MSDYSELLTTMARAQGELAWLLPEGKWKEAKEKALLVEQTARALVELCKRHGNEPKMIFAHIACYTDAVGVNGGKATSSR
jgi:hypothetical protein